MPKIDACNFTSVNLKMHTNSCCLLLMNLLDLIQTKFLYAFESYLQEWSSEMACRCYK